MFLLGYNEVKYNLDVEQGCVFYKLFIRAFPDHFTFNSIYAHYPLTIPSENKKIMKNLGRLDDYSWDRPAKIAARIDVASYDGVTTILKDGEVFGVDPWRRGLYFLMGKPGANFMLAGDGAFFAERRNQMKECLYQSNWNKSIKYFYEHITLALLKQYSYGITGETKQVDIIRDVGNSGQYEHSFTAESFINIMAAHVHFASNIFSLPLKSEAHPKGVYTEHELYGILAVSDMEVLTRDFTNAVIS